ncbi:MAG: hypothetical protein HFI14_09055 [Lachnospiraceae bacterium]|nr:hypothetical protein [Lachnospiraceae bacterium]
MARKGLKPVSLAGIEFDALIDEQKTMSATIPTYPVEDGFPISDTIILDPIKVQMTLYVSNTPVTWLYRHGSSNDRVNRICEQIENLWLDKELVKVVTTDTIYKDMGITSITIKKSRESGYAREISLSLQKVRITKVLTVIIPSYVLKGGKTMANAGTASVSASSGKSSSAGVSSSSSASSSSSESNAKKSQSILYGVASGLGFL